MSNETVNTAGSVPAAVAQPVMDVMANLNELKRRAEMVSVVKSQLMCENTHFGVIPGCGNKPTLLKNGAELLCMAFKLASDARVEVSDLGNGHREYTVTTTLAAIGSGELIATGLGSCSTMESKYRYRGNEAVNTGKPVPKEYWNAKRNGNAQEMKRILGGAGFKAQKDDGGNWMIYQKSEKKLENPDIADTYNTVLKMASKRSLVDAVLKATGGSCEFTQDIEDMAATADTYAETSYGDSDYSAQIEDEGLANFRASMDKMHGDCPEAYDDTMQKLGYASIEAVPAAERQKVYRKVYNGLCAYFSARKSAQQEAGEVNGEVENG